MQEHCFKTCSGEEIAPREMVARIVTGMKEKPTYDYRITVGTDSQRLQNGGAEFVTAVVVHRVGNGGNYFWRRFRGKNYHTLRHRIIDEVLASLSVAQELLAMLKEQVETLEAHSTHWEFEVHADIGVNGPTKDMMQEVLGMIRAYNFEARMKPESYAASNIADRHT